MEKIKIKIINQSTQNLPEYQSDQAAGVDLRANIESEIELKSLQRLIVPTGLFMEIPKGYEAQIRPRSGLALKHGITVLNSPGTIDSDYRGEIKVLLVNISDKSFKIAPGERIAQMVFSSFKKASFVEIEKLEETNRGAEGFGSTGVK